jgi:hypothetical protein
LIPRAGERGVHHADDLAALAHHGDQISERTNDRDHGQHQRIGVTRVLRDDPADRSARDRDNQSIVAE